jgi:hypothetical protein
MKKITLYDTALIIELAHNHQRSYIEQFPTYCSNTHFDMFLAKAVDEVVRFDVFISDDFHSHLVLEDYTDPCVDPTLRVYYVRKMYTRDEYRQRGLMKELVSKAKAFLETDFVYSELGLHSW